MWHMNDGWGWWMLFGTILMVGFWFVIIWAVAKLGQGSTGTLPPQPPRVEEPTALQILKRRYASGDLSDEEFEAKKQRLTESTTDHSFSR